jgi:hypothetical protein
MADSGELSPSPEAVAALYPYGVAGYSIGKSAQFFRGALVPKRPPSTTAHRHRYWTEQDHRSFGSALNLERRSRSLRMSPGVPLEQRKTIADQLLGSLATLREALPYSEAERRWLVDTRERHEERKVPFVDGNGVTRGLVRPPADELLQDLKATEGEIVSAGIHQIVQGRDLARRWWSWRRQTDEFADQGSREIVHAALKDLSDMLVPSYEQHADAGVPWPHMPEQL